MEEAGIGLPDGAGRRREAGASGLAAGFCRTTSTTRIARRNRRDDGRRGHRRNLIASADVVYRRLLDPGVGLPRDLDLPPRSASGIFGLPTDRIICFGLHEE